MLSFGFKGNSIKLKQLQDSVEKICSFLLFFPCPFSTAGLATSQQKK